MKHVGLNDPQEVFFLRTYKIQYGGTLGETLFAIRDYIFAHTSKIQSLHQNTSDVRIVSP